MKTKKGAFRLVIFGKNNVYKIATLRYFWGVVKSIPRMLMHGDGKFIAKELLWGLKNFIRGINENRSEQLCWKRLKSPFLARTVWGFGLINIQKRAYGESPSNEELNRTFSQLPPQAQQALHNVEAHCLEPGNFIKTPIGLIVVDYDNGSGPIAKKYPFTVFLEQWHKELSRYFIPKV